MQQEGTRGDAHRLLLLLHALLPRLCAFVACRFYQSTSTGASLVSYPCFLDLSLESRQESDMLPCITCRMFVSRSSLS